MGRDFKRGRAKVMRLAQLIAFLVVFVVGALIVSKKVLAQPKVAPKTPAEAAAALGPGPVAKPAKDGKPAKDAGPDATKSDAGAASPATASGGDAGPVGDGGEAPIDYASVQGPDDFPKGMSDEERASIGTGKVPIHRDGPFKSPFAHPRFGGPTTAKVGVVIQQVREYSIQTGAFEAEFYLSLTGDKDFPKLDPYFTNGHEVEIKVLADRKSVV